MIVAGNLIARIFAFYSIRV